MPKSRILKSLVKKIKNNTTLNYIIKNLIYFYVRLLFLTYRPEIEFDQNFEQPFHKNSGVFYFWHQNIIAATFFFHKIKGVGHCVVSPSGDGKIIGFIAEKLGFKVLYGSAYKRSVKIVRQALDVLDTNKRLCIVGDGSRGPAFQLQRGVIYFASKSNLPLVFVDCKAKWAMSFDKSWDKFQIPLPFSKIFIKVHPPVLPSKDAYKNY